MRAKLDRLDPLRKSGADFFSRGTNVRNASRFRERPDFVGSLPSASLGQQRRYLLGEIAEGRRLRNVMTHAGLDGANDVVARLFAVEEDGGDRLRAGNRLHAAHELES